MIAMELRGNFDFEPSGFFVMRTPLLPWNDLEAWSEGLAIVGLSDQADQSDRSGRTHANSAHGLAAALDSDRRLLRERLRAALLKPEVREAVFIASPNLEASIETWLAKPETERGFGLELALARYYERMCARPTPFGLCAGLSVGEAGSRTRLVLAERAVYRRHTRPDMEYLGALIRILEQQPELRSRLTFRPNGTLYASGGRLRYVERRFSEKGFSDCVVSAEKTDYLAALLDRAAGGQRAEVLAESLVEGDITREEAMAFVDELIGSQILVPDLPSQVTGLEPLPALLASLNTLGEPALAAAGKLELLQRQLAGWDAAGIGRPPRAYRDLAAQLEPIPAKPELATMFQVDMVKPVTQATLDQVALTEIARGIELLRRVSREFGPHEIDRFRETFFARYEYREVPLTEALDEECGLPFPVPEEPSSPERVPPRRQPWGRGHWTALDDWMLRKLTTALASSAAEIKLDPKEIESRGEKKLPPLPDSFAVTAIIAAGSEADFDAGRFQILLQLLEGPSGAELFGRFCHADENLTRHVRAHLAREEARQPDTIFAEIVHLPESRMANILARPVLRAYEIPYFGGSGASPANQLPVTDLWLSAEGERLVLRSQRLGRRVIPRMTTAHNYILSKVPIYRFLCSLAHQDAVGVGWDWGPLGQAPFLPRVSCGRLVFSRAAWNLEKLELSKLKRPSTEARFEASRELRSARRLPRWVVLADGDNMLPIDFDNCLSVENFVHLVHERDGAVLTELYPSPDQLLARGPEGKFVHELIVPFVRKKAQKAATAGNEGNKDPDITGPPSPTLSNPLSTLIPFSSSSAQPRRSPDLFPPGSHWLFTKLYCGVATADLLLREILPGFIEKIRSEEWADRWFFIRYADPDQHLRLRFRGEPEKLLGRLVPNLNKLLEPHLSSGALARWQIDTYQPETRRYGGPDAIELAEELFEADSDAVLAILAAAGSGDASTDQRWRLGICGVDRFLTDLGLELRQRLEVVTGARAGMALPAGVDPDQEHQLSRDFRRERKTLETMLRGEIAPDGPLAPVHEALDKRGARIRPVAMRLRDLQKIGRLSKTILELSHSHIHMHVNRLLRSRHQEMELVIYDSLVRLYDSLLARGASV